MFLKNTYQSRASIELYVKLSAVEATEVLVAIDLLVDDIHRLIQGDPCNREVKEMRDALGILSAVEKRINDALQEASRGE